MADTNEQRAWSVRAAESVRYMLTAMRFVLFLPLLPFVVLELVGLLLTANPRNVPDVPPLTRWLFGIGAQSDRA